MMGFVAGFRDDPAYCLNLYIVLCIIISATYKSHIILKKNTKQNKTFKTYPSRNNSLLREGDMYKGTVK